MSRKFNDNKTELIIDYTLEGAEWEEALNKTRKILAKDITIPGFRKGKAPLSEATKRISLVKIFDKTISDNIDDIYRKHITTQITNEDMLADNVRPKFDVVNLSLEKVVFEFIFPLFPKITIGNYKKIQAKLNSLTLSKEELEETKHQLLTNYVVMLDSNEAIKWNDQVNFDFTGYIDNEKFEGGEAEKFDLVIGSNQFIPGFEEKMIGLKKGETKDLHLTFPKEYHAKNLAGKDVIFKVTIHNIKTPNYPEINEQFLQEIKINPLVKTPADFEKYLEITALKNKLQKNKTNFINSAIEEITSNSKVEMSEIIVDQTANGYYRDFLTQIKQRGVSEKEYIEFSKTTKDEILDLYKKEATKNLIKSYIYGKIVDEEKLHISDEEYDKRIKQLADLYGLKEDQIKTFVPFKNFEQEKLADRIFDKLAQLNDPENLKKYHEIQKEVDDYHSEIEKILVAEAKKKSAQEKVNKEK